jgi:glycosyltransferase involved in cell wall biosynthesis
MPCLLKQRTPTSPGIITFTHNEVLYGVAAKSKKVIDFLERTSVSRQWVYGVHIQSDCSHMETWPQQDWRSFLMWPNPSTSVRSAIPPAGITPITCTNFLPKPSERDAGKSWDICVVSRPSEIKRITETLLLIQHLFTLKEDLKVILVVPDPRDQALGDKAYRKQDIDRNYFELPRKIFTCKQLKRISFISSSQRAFGTFPVSDDLIADILARSRFLLLTSYREGGPRVIAEAFTHGTPCIVSKRLVSGMDQYLTNENTVFIDDDIATAAQQIVEGLNQQSRFKIDKVAMQELFCDAGNLPVFREFLSEKIRATGSEINGEWFLDELDFRLACHGRKHNMQFMNDDRLFFDWIAKIENCPDREPDEDYLFGYLPLVDKKRINAVEVKAYFRSRIWHPALRGLKSLLRP